MPYFILPSFGIGWVVAIVLVIGLSLTVELIRNANLEIDKVEENIEDPVILKVTLSQTNTTSPQDAENLLSMFHGIIANKQKSYYHFSLEFSQSSYGIQFYIVIPPRFKTFVINQLYANYPQAEIQETLDYSAGVSSKNAIDLHVAVADIEMVKDYIFPLKTYKKLTYDPLSTMLASGEIQEHEMLAVQMLIRPVNSKWQKIGRSYLDNLRNGIHPKGKGKLRKDTIKVLKRIYEGVFSIRHLHIKPVSLIDQTQQAEIADIEDKVSKQGYEVLTRVIATSKSEEKSYDLISSFVSSLTQFSSNHLNSLIAKYYTKTFGEESLEEEIYAFRERKLAIESNDIWNVEEIASLYHFPNSRVSVPSIAWSRAKKVEPPSNLPTDTPILGKTNYRDNPKIFGIKAEDRRRHMYVIGKTGTGKTTLLKQMIIQDILNGEGVGVIDPHGELAREILDFIPKERIKDVIYIDPSDANYSPSINIFNIKDPLQREYIASAILEVFKKHFDSWGPRLEYILHNTILSLLYVEGETFLGIQRMLTDYQYRQYVLSHITDTVLKKFWEDEYSQIERNSRLLAETISPIQNKVGRFLASNSIRRCVGQSEGTIDFDEILADKKILICNLSQGRLGEENASLLGSLIVTRLQSAAMARVALLESQRSDFYFYVDEFQSTATTSFMKILSEARKYKFNLILAHQYLAQIPPAMQYAIQGNAGTFVSFTLGAEDASTIEKEFFPTIHSNDLISLDKYQFYIKELIDGFVAKPFSAQTFIMDFEVQSDSRNVIDASQKQYSKPTAEIDIEINTWNMKSFTIHERAKRDDNNLIHLFAEENKGG